MLFSDPKSNSVWVSGREVQVQYRQTFIFSPPSFFLVFQVSLFFSFSFSFFLVWVSALAFSFIHKLKSSFAFSSFFFSSFLAFSIFILMTEKRSGCWSLSCGLYVYTYRTRDKQHTCNRLYSILLFTWLPTPDPIANCYCDERTYSISLLVVWGQRKKEKEKKGKCPSVLNSWLIVC